MIQSWFVATTYAHSGLYSLHTHTYMVYGGICTEYKNEGLAIEMVCIKARSIYQMLDVLETSDRLQISIHSFTKTCRNYLAGMSASVVIKC